MTMYTPSKQELNGGVNEANGLMTIYTPSKTESRDGEGELRGQWANDHIYHIFKSRIEYPCTAAERWL